MQLTFSLFKIFLNTPYFVNKKEVTCMKNLIFDLIVRNISGVTSMNNDIYNSKET